MSDTWIHVGDAATKVVEVIRKRREQEMRTAKLIQSLKDSIVGLDKERTGNE